MLRLESPTGWWLTTHPDHAKLAAAFAEHWGNDRFAPPEPRAHVLKAIAAHGDGWASRDAAPQITLEGKPSAFSTALVGKYPTFEEIDLADYLAVRDRAVKVVAVSDGYAALLVSMYTYNLLTTRVDRSVLVPEQLQLLDAFLADQKALQQTLFASIQEDRGLSVDEKSRERIDDLFRLLQACDCLSFLTCVDYHKPATLLYPLRLKEGGVEPVMVESLGERYFCLTPYPLDVSPVTVEFPTRHVEGKTFASVEGLQQQFTDAEVTMLKVTVTA
jgi:Protein of unknown function (DUF3891)